MTDGGVINLAIISIGSETAKTLNTTELIKYLHLLKIGKSHFSGLKFSKCLSLSVIVCLLYILC